MIGSHISYLINHKSNRRLQVLELSDCIKSRARGLHWIDVGVSYDQRLWITLMQVCQQPSQRIFLRLGTGVLRSLAIDGKSTHIRHADGVSVMILAMCSHHLFRSARFDGPIGRNHVVVSATQPTEGTMIAVDVRHPKDTARLIGGAVYDNQSNLSHGINKIRVA